MVRDRGYYGRGLQSSFEQLEPADIYEKQMVDLYYCQYLILDICFPKVVENSCDQIFVNDHNRVIEIKCSLNILSLSDHIQILLDLELSTGINEKTDMHQTEF